MTIYLPTYPCTCVSERMVVASSVLEVEEVVALAAVVV